MGKKSRLRIQQKIEVISAPDGERYKSSIQEMDEKTIAISVPVRGGQYLLLHRGETVQAEFAVQDAAYAFSTVVLARKKSNHVPLVVLARPTMFSRRQRRNFVRFPILMPVQFRIQRAHAHFGAQADEVFSGKVIDISGGGLQVSSSQNVETGDSVLAIFGLNDSNPLLLHVFGIVTWVFKDEWTRNTRFGIRFCDIKESDRERIISFIFHMMRQRTHS